MPSKLPVYHLDTKIFLYMIYDFDTTEHLPFYVWISYVIDHCKAMKMSFSLSSLQPLGHGLEKHGQAGIAIERPYNSLTKKRFVSHFIFLS